LFCYYYFEKLENRSLFAWEGHKNPFNAIFDICNMMKRTKEKEIEALKKCVACPQENFLLKMLDGSKQIQTKINIQKQVKHLKIGYSEEFADSIENHNKMARI
jgi:hypothetical protein